MTIERTSASLARYEERPYTTVINETLAIIECPIAFSIYVYLQSKPENWTVRRQDVMNRFSIGRDRYDKAIRKLKELGLVSHVRETNEAGQVIKWDLVIHYEPQH